MERKHVSMVTRQFKRTFGEDTLNELGRGVRFCRREREVTPFRLALSLIESFSSSSVRCIADLQRGFNALCGTNVRYKPFHNQLAKRQFPTFLRLLLSRMLNELACEVLRFSPQSPFAQFEHIRIQDGTSFALKSALVETFPGRFTEVSPAAVELHVELDVMSEMVNQVVLSPDSFAERQFLPDVDQLKGGLLLADRGYFSRAYFDALDRAGGHFIVRASNSINPLVLAARRPDGRVLKRLANRRVKDVVSTFRRFAHLDMDIAFDAPGGPWQCRLVVHRNARGAPARYLVTNLDESAFSPQHIDDAYRLRWQVELLFKQWKSHANLHAFDTANAHIAEGLIWAALCAATLKRFCAHMAERCAKVPISTHTVAKCSHHVLGTILYTLIHRRGALHHAVQRALEYLAANAQRARPQRDRHRGRLKIGLEHVYACA